MERYSVVLPIRDYLRSTGLPGRFGRCALWNFVDDWLPAFGGMGLPPNYRVLWLPEVASFQETKRLLIAEAQRERTKLLEGLGGIERLDILSGQELGASAAWQEQVGKARQRGLFIP